MSTVAAILWISGILLVWLVVLGIYSVGLFRLIEAVSLVKAQRAKRDKFVTVSARRRR